MINTRTLLDAIETSPFLLPELPGQVEWLSIPGLRGRITPASDHFANFVGASTLTSDNADETIRRVFDIFCPQRKAFAWQVGPLSTPDDLGERLMRAGLFKMFEEAGMVLNDLRTPIRINPAVHIREATVADSEIASQVLAPALEVDHGGARAVTASLLQGQGIEKHVYLAFLDGVESPVGYAASIYVPSQPIVLLFCAATLSQYRGHGIYKSLVARRIQDAARDGMQAAIIQAVRTSSAPICARLGFAELGGLAWYGWSPE